ncbi:MAG: hypothetical protein HZC17_07805 [Candidatus Omnitrophica bacterium]|nr:hypothetical protein [Candidatus Omnitrophota bacterium]
MKTDKAFAFFLAALLISGCTVKAVGDPNRPITINAHVTIDIRGMKETATNIEDFVSGQTNELKTKSGEQK